MKVNAGGEPPAKRQRLDSAAEKGEGKKRKRVIHFRRFNRTRVFCKTLPSAAVNLADEGLVISKASRHYHRAFAAAGYAEVNRWFLEKATADGGCDAKRGEAAVEGVSS